MYGQVLQMSYVFEPRAADGGPTLEGRAPVSESGAAENDEPARPKTSSTKTPERIDVPGTLQIVDAEGRTIEPREGTVYLPGGETPVGQRGNRKGNQESKKSRPCSLKESDFQAGI